MAKKKVLLVDGDKKFMDTWGGILEISGIEVLKSPDGASCAILARTHQPNLIILGVELDDVNGYLVCKKLREDAKSRIIPIFMVSSSSTEKDFERHKNLRVKADEYFRKPLAEDEFREKIQDVLGIELKTSRKGFRSTDGTADADNAEIATVKEKVKSLEMEADLLRNDLENVKQSRETLAKSLRAEVENERMKASSSQQEIKSLQQDIRELKKKLEAAEKDYARSQSTTRDEIAAQQKKLKAAEDEKRKLKEDISIFRNELGKFKDKNIYLENILSEKEKEITQLNGYYPHIRDLEETVSNLTQERDRFKEEIEIMKHESGKETTVLADKINVSTEEKEIYREEIAKCKLQIDKLQDELKTKEFEIEEFSLNIKNLQQALEDKDTNIQKMLEHKDNAANGIDPGLNERVQTLENLIAEKDEEILRFTGLQDSVNEINAELNLARSRESELKGRVSELEELRRKDEQMLNTLDRVVKEKEELLKKMDELGDVKNSHSEESPDKISSFEVEISSLVEKLREKEKELDSLKELVDVQMEEKAALNKELEKYKATLSAAEQQIGEEKDEEPVLLEEAQMVESAANPETKPAAANNGLEKMVNNILKEDEIFVTKEENPAMGDKFFEMDDFSQVGEKTKNETNEQKTKKWENIINQYNGINRQVFNDITSSDSTLTRETIWGEFLAEQNEKQNSIFKGTQISEDGSISTDQVIKNLIEVSEREKIQSIPGMEDLFINQKLKNELNEFIDFLIIISRRIFQKDKSAELIKFIKEKQKTIQ